MGILGSERITGYPEKRPQGGITPHLATTLRPGFVGCKDEHIEVAGPLMDQMNGSAAFASTFFASDWRVQVAAHLHRNITLRQIIIERLLVLRPHQSVPCNPRWSRTLLKDPRVSLLPVVAKRASRRSL